MKKILETGKSKSLEWQTHGIASAYEKYIVIGKRKERQTSYESITATVSKTIAGDMDCAQVLAEMRCKQFLISAE